MIELVGRVAAIIDCYHIAINRGSEHGVAWGNTFAINWKTVIDPETGEDLGQIPGLRVKVSEIYPKFCVAETFSDGQIVPILSRPKEFEVNIGDEARLM